MSTATHSGYDLTTEDIGYDSTNEDDIETKDAKRARRDLADKPKYDKREKAKVSHINAIIETTMTTCPLQAHSSVFSAEAAADEGRRQRVQLLQLNAYDRHKQLVNTYQVQSG